LKSRLEPEFKAPLAEGRLLIITPFNADTKSVTIETARLRNQMMMEIADRIVIGYSSPGGELEKLLLEHQDKNYITL
jgi:hypothetical protein